MAPGDVETYFAEGVWRNRIVGRGEVPGAHPSRQEAARAGLELALSQDAHHVIRYADTAE